MSRIFVSLLWGAIVASACGCHNASGVIVPTFDLALCVLRVDEAEPAGTPVEKVVVDAIAQCGGDAANILALVTSERRAGAHHAPIGACK
jgi:hypothetical protein